MGLGSHMTIIQDELDLAIQGPTSASALPCPPQTWGPHCYLAHCTWTLPPPPPPADICELVHYNNAIHQPAGRAIPVQNGLFTPFCMVDSHWYFWNGR